MARKAKPKNIADDQITSSLSPQERWERHYPAIKKAKADLDSEQATAKKIVGAANGVYRNALKQFKKDGGNIAVMIRVLEDLKREPDEVAKDHMDYNAYAVLADLLVGTQLGMLGVPHASPKGGKGGGKVADFKEGRPLTTDAVIAKAKTQGFDAGTDGKSPSENPHPEGSPEFLAWSGEWKRAQEKIADKFKGPARAEPAQASA